MTHYDDGWTYCEMCDRGFSQHDGETLCEACRLTRYVCLDCGAQAPATEEDLHECPPPEPKPLDFQEAINAVYGTPAALDEDI